MARVPAEIKIIECPRDAMQGWKEWIATEDKVRYLNSLLKIGFDTIDFGSFVSEKAIPQLKDTALVLENLDLSETGSKLLAIVANTRGAIAAAAFSAITYIGFPFSISETFQVRNTNKSIAEALQTIDDIHKICLENNKILVIYISMGFGNPYGDQYSEGVVLNYVELFSQKGIQIISLADTVGVATPPQISSILQYIIPKYPKVEFGVHLHASAATQEPKILAALQAGCKRFDGALKGIGGCPMADDDLVGNVNTEQMIGTFHRQGLNPQIDEEALTQALHIASEIFHL